MSKKEIPFNGDYEDSEEDSESVSSESEEEQPKKKLKKKTIKNGLIMNVSDTQYPVVKFVGKKLFNFKLSYIPYTENYGWDLCWTDNAVLPETLSKMQPHQKINHMPGMYCLARKNHLGRNLTKMVKQFPEKFDFFPRTWLLPSEYGDFKQQFTKGKAKTFIVKPEASCQGRGIFLTRSIDSINPTEHYVAQRYIHKPFLIDGLKFDFRLYVLIAGCDPLRIYLFKEGLARFATQPYVPPHSQNLDDACMHLTNYAINKDNPNFIFNQNEQQMDIGHKRSFTSVIQLMDSMGLNTKQMMEEVKDLIIKTFCSVQPILQSNYTQPDNFANNMCFEVLGFDILIDHHLKPYLLEVNHTPSFTTDTPLDSFIKKNIIRDTIKIMNINLKTKNDIVTIKKDQMQRRVLTGKKQKYTFEEKRLLKQQAQLERDEYENQNLGDYEKIYPLDKNYDEFIQYAQKLYEEWTGANIRRNPKKEETQLAQSMPPKQKEQNKVQQKSKLYQNVQSKVNTNLYPKIDGNKVEMEDEQQTIKVEQYREKELIGEDDQSSPLKIKKEINFQVHIRDVIKSVEEIQQPIFYQQSLTCLSPMLQRQQVQQPKKFSIRKQSKMKYSDKKFNDSDQEIEPIKAIIEQRVVEVFKKEMKEVREIEKFDKNDKIDKNDKSDKNGSFIKPKIFSLKIHQPQKGYKLQQLPILIQQNYGKYRYE